MRMRRPGITNCRNCQLGLGLSVPVVAREIGVLTSRCLSASRALELSDPNADPNSFTVCAHVVPTPPSRVGIACNLAVNPLKMHP